MIIWFIRVSSLKEKVFIIFSIRVYIKLYDAATDIFDLWS